MGGLLKKLAKGLGAGMTSYGQSMLENKRQARLESIRKSERTEDKEFKTSEREAKQTFDAGESELDRKARIEAAKHRGTTRGASNESVKNIKTVNDDFGTPISESWSVGNEMFKKDLTTGEVTKTTKDGKTTVVQAADAESGFETASERDAREKTVTGHGETWANAQAGWFSSDARDFKLLPKKYRTEDKAVQLYKLLASKAPDYDRFKLNAKNHGTKFLKAAYDLAMKNGIIDDF
ncbi:MAG: hypothetical protein GY746_08975 [Gammaproteobacteria bacterium]|nr:hypothetical protein [Gammaproteobacteria bacterium]